MLTGELPGEPMEVPSKKVHIDVRLDAVVLRALEKSPELRFQQVSEFKTSVETVQSAETPAASASLKPAYLSVVNVTLASVLWVAAELGQRVHDIDAGRLLVMLFKQRHGWCSQSFVLCKVD